MWLHRKRLGRMLICGRYCMHRDRSALYTTVRGFGMSNSLPSALTYMVYLYTSPEESPHTTMLIPEGYQQRSRERRITLYISCEANVVVIAPPSGGRRQPSEVGN